MGYEDFEDLARKLTFNNILFNIAFDIAKNPKYDGINVVLHVVLLKVTLSEPRISRRNTQSNY